eukprot:426957_1
MEQSVAVNFCMPEGLIVELEMFANEWKYKFNEGVLAEKKWNCFDCQWISDYINEKEILFIGGLGNFVIKTIIDSFGTNYIKYIKGIKQCTYNCVVGDAWSDPMDFAKTKQEKQMVFRLWSYRLYRSNPNHTHAHEFKSCPDYIKNILHSHCERVKQINFNFNGTNMGKVPDKFFKTEDNHWIQLHLVTALYPNVEKISITCRQNDISFFKDREASEQVVRFLQNRKQNNLKNICFRLDPIESSITDIKQYFDGSELKTTLNNDFKWNIDVIRTKKQMYGLGDVVNEMYVSDEKIELMVGQEQELAALLSCEQEENVCDIQALVMLVSGCLCIVAYKWREYSDSVEWNTFDIFTYILPKLIIPFWFMLMLIIVAFRLFKFIRLKCSDAYHILHRAIRNMSQLIYKKQCLYLSQIILFNISLNLAVLSHKTIQRILEAIYMILILAVPIFIINCHDQEAYSLIVHIFLCSTIFAIFMQQYLMYRITISTFILCCYICYSAVRTLETTYILILISCAFLYRIITWEDTRTTNIVFGGAKSIATFLSKYIQAPTDLERFQQKVFKYFRIANNTLLLIVKLVIILFPRQLWWQIEIVWLLFEKAYSSTKQYKSDYPFLHLITIYGTPVWCIVIQSGFNYISIILALTSCCLVKILKAQLDVTIISSIKNFISTFVISYKHLFTTSMQDWFFMIFVMKQIKELIVTIFHLWDFLSFRPNWQFAPIWLMIFVKLRDHQSHWIVAHIGYMVIAMWIFVIIIRFLFGIAIIIAIRDDDWRQRTTFVETMTVIGDYLLFYIFWYRLD